MAREVLDRPRGPRFRASGLARALLRGALGLVLALAAYVTLVQLDLVRSPLDPSLRGDIALAKSGREGVRVLFVGNSYTYENGMPSLLRDLAADAGAPPILAASYTAPGWSLKRASADGGLTALLREVRWDLVVLQEASRIPALPAEVRDVEMHPYTTVLARDIRSAGARPALFMTWGYRDGDDRSAESDTFAAMQARLRHGYEEEGSALAAPVVPVGLAWATALRGRPDLDLWAGDGKHPSRLGSYLAACVFLVALTGADASESEFLAGLPAADARYLQRVATDVVSEAGPRGTLLGPGGDAVSELD